MQLITFGLRMTGNSTPLDFVQNIVHIQLRTMQSGKIISLELVQKSIVQVDLEQNAYGSLLNELIK